MKKSVSTSGGTHSTICRKVCWLTLYATILVAPFSCAHKNINKNADRNDWSPQGTYKGVFTRSSPLAKYASSNITITFTENKFSGESDQRNYPAICDGTFKVTGTEIEFINECMWTADFDWTYILKDKFKLRQDGDKIEMIKSVDEHTDQYTLTLQK